MHRYDLRHFFYSFFRCSFSLLRFSSLSELSPVAPFFGSRTEFFLIDHSLKHRSVTRPPSVPSDLFRSFSFHHVVTDILYSHVKVFPSCALVILNFYIFSFGFSYFSRLAVSLKCLVFFCFSRQVTVGQPRVSLSCLLIPPPCSAGRVVVFGLVERHSHGSFCRPPTRELASDPLSPVIGFSFQDFSEDSPSCPNSYSFLVSVMGNPLGFPQASRHRSSSTLFRFSSASWAYLDRRAWGERFMGTCHLLTPFFGVGVCSGPYPHFTSPT